jgi:dGTPase
MENICFREETEKREYETLAPYAAKAAESRGRERELAPCPLRTVYQRDRDRIVHCKSFRRLKHKTQVFLSPEGDHYRTRLTHTLEVSQIARTISRCLRLNEDLTEAIAMGHDLGHTPFGHSGERVLDELTGLFEHNEQSLRVVTLLENNGEGLNLTFEVRDGILNHKKSLMPATLEGMVVNYSDRIAYINHDIDDALRAGLIGSIPGKFTRAFGETQSERIDAMLRDVVTSSFGALVVRMSENIEALTEELRQFMFSHVYFGSKAKEEEGKAENMIRLLYRHYCDKPQDMGPDALNHVELYGASQAVTDYIAGMTDRFAVNAFREIYIPRGWDKY